MSKIFELYLSDRTDEVNILSCGYGDSLKNVGSNVIQISDVELYSGPIATGSKGGGFVDIVRIGAPPPVEFLYASLFRKRPGALR